MLTGLNINNFAIIKQLHVDFAPGMNVITGETGAGKSIAIDALSLCMGYRSDVGMIRNGAKQSTVSASFTIDKNSIAYKWLEEKSLLDEDEPTEINIRRVLNLNGPSKAYINEHPVSISALKEITQYLVHLHGQHAPQLLLKNSYQLTLVDRFINQKELLESVAQAYRNYQQSKQELNEFLTKKEANLNNQQLIEYKLSELAEYKLQEGEYEQLETDFKLLSNQATIQESSQYIVNTLSQSQANILNLLDSVITKTQTLVEFDGKYKNLLTILEEAQINLNEANNEALHLLNAEVDAESLDEVAQRINIYNSLAKKNQVLPEELYKYYLQLKSEKEELDKSVDIEDELQAKVEQAKEAYRELANQLTEQRTQGAAELSGKVVDILQSLNMKGADFYIEVNADANKISELGSDEICFMLNSNLGQQSQELSKVASGGELSRIALAIQLLTASHLDNGTLIFDEVDVGISGKTATVVGRIIRQLSQKVQVISVTHLAQVAAYATHHYQVEKAVVDGESTTKMRLLETADKVYALASLIGHEELTDEAMDNARSLLEKSQNDPQI